MRRGGEATALGGQEPWCEHGTVEEIGHQVMRGQEPEIKCQRSLARPRPPGGPRALISTSA